MLKMIVIDVFVLSILVWGVILFLHYKEQEKERKNNGWSGASHLPLFDDQVEPDEYEGNRWD